MSFSFTPLSQKVSIIFKVVAELFRPSSPAFQLSSPVAPVIFSGLPRSFFRSSMAEQPVDRLALMNAASQSRASKKGTIIPIHSSYMSLIDMINVRGDDFPSNAKFDSYDHCNKFHEDDTIASYNSLFNIPPGYRLVKPSPGDRTCNFRRDAIYVYRDALLAGIRFPLHDFIPTLLADIQVNPSQLPPNAWRKGHRLSVAVFRKIFQLVTSPLTAPGWVYIKQRPKTSHIFNGLSIPDNNFQWKDEFMLLFWEGGDWGTIFRPSFGRVNDGSPKTIELSIEEQAIYDDLIKDNGQTHSWTLLEEFSLKSAGLSNVSDEGSSLSFIF